jgi:hypothetical protein
MQLLLRIGIALCLTALLSGAMPFVMRNDPLKAPGAAGCTMAYDNVATAASGGGGGSLTFNYTPIGNLTAVFLGYQGFSGGIATATFGGVTLNSIVSFTSGAGVGAGGILGVAFASPPVGVQSVVANDTTAFFDVGVIGITCSNTTTLIDNSQTGTGTATSTSITPVNTTTAELVVDVLNASTAAAPVTTNGTGQVVRASAVTSGGIFLYMSTTPGTSTTATPGYTFGGGSNGYGIGAVSVKHQ